MLIEIELQLFIGNIDTQLFKGILLKIFKTKDIQDSNFMLTGARETEIF